MTLVARRCRYSLSKQVKPHLYGIAIGLRRLEFRHDLVMVIPANATRHDDTIDDADIAAFELLDLDTLEIE